MSRPTPGQEKRGHGGEKSANPTKRTGEQLKVEKRTYTSKVGKNATPKGSEFVHDVPGTGARGAVANTGQKLQRADSVEEIA